MGGTVSVIIPIYKVENYLCQCLDSVENQTYRDLEIILVDDGSPDRCGEICDKYARKDSRIQVIHKENEGVSVARNVGIEAAHGEWVMFVDPDDWIETDYCEMLLKAIEKKPWDIVFGLLEQNSEDGTKTVMPCSATRPHAESRAEIMKRQLDVLAGKNANKGISSVQAGALINRKLLDNKACRFPPGVKKRQDFIFYFRLTEFAQSAYYTNQAVYHYRMRSDSVCHKFEPRIVDYVLDYCHAAASFVEEYHADEQVYVQKLGLGIIDVYSEIARIYCFHKESTASFKIYKECMSRFYEDPCVEEYIEKGDPSDFAGIRKRIKCWGIKHKYVHLTYVMFWLLNRVRG